MQAPTNAISLPYSLACYLPPLLFTHHNHISVVPPPNTLPPASCYSASISISISLQELLGRALAEARVQRRCLLQHSLTLARRNWSARHLVAIEQRLAGLGCRARLLHWLVGGTLNVLLDQRLCSMLRLFSRRASWYLARRSTLACVGAYRVVLHQLLHRLVAGGYHRVVELLLALDGATLPLQPLHQYRRSSGSASTTYASFFRFLGSALAVGRRIGPTRSLLLGGTRHALGAELARLGLDRADEARLRERQHPLLARLGVRLVGVGCMAAVAIQHLGPLRLARSLEALELLL